MEKVELRTADIAAENAAKLAELFPDIVTEVLDEDGNVHHSIDVEALKAHVGDIAEDKRERYQFTWPGKQRSRAEAIRPISKTMRPAPEESVSWDTTENLYIEGDNLDALKILRETYAGKIKMIYIDPPYNTGHDFVYNDDFARSAEEERAESGAFDEEGNVLDAAYKVNNESNGKFHSDWCSMMYPRLMLARDLLSENGVIFVSIDDGEFSNLKKLLDAVFGEGGYLNCINIKAKASAGASGGGEDRRLKKNIEYLFAYVKSASFRSFNEVKKKQLLKSYITERKEAGTTFAYKSVLLDGGEERYIGDVKAGNGEPISLYKMVGYEVKPVSRIARDSGLSEEEVYEKYINRIFTLENAQTSIRDRVLDGAGSEDDFVVARYIPVSGRNKGKMTSVGFMGKTKRLVSYLAPLCVTENGKVYKTDKIGTLWDDLSWSAVHMEGGVSFPNGKKPVSLIRRLLEMQADSESVVLDFFSGSATTAHAVMQLNAEDSGNRKFIMVQLPEVCDEKSEAAKAGYKNICEIGKERIRRAGAKIAREVEEANAQLKLGEEPGKKVPDVGFRVLKIDSTNFEDVSRPPDTLFQDELFGLADNLKSDRTPEDILFELLPKFQIPYTARIEQLDLCGKTVYSVDDDTLLACFDREVPEGVVRAMAEREPSWAVLRDASFVGDDALANFEEIFKSVSPATKTRVV